MPITTYLTDFEKMTLIACGDKEINGLLTEVNSKIGDGGKYLIRERFRAKGRLWWKKLETFYTLYYECGLIDTQIINFSGEGTSPTKHTIENYFIGLLNGLDARLKVNDQPQGG